MDLERLESILRRRRASEPDYSRDLPALLDAARPTVRVRSRVSARSAVPLAAGLAMVVIVAFAAGYPALRGSAPAASDAAARTPTPAASTHAPSAGPAATDGSSEIRYTCGGMQFGLDALLGPATALDATDGPASALRALLGNGAYPGVAWRRAADGTDGVLFLGSPADLQTWIPVVARPAGGGWQAAPVECQGGARYRDYEIEPWVAQFTGPGLVLTPDTTEFTVYVNKPHCGEGNALVDPVVAYGTDFVVLFFPAVRGHAPASLPSGAVWGCTSDFESMPYTITLREPLGNRRLLEGRAWELPAAPSSVTYATATPAPSLVPLPFVRITPAPGASYGTGEALGSSVVAQLPASVARGTTLHFTLLIKNDSTAPLEFRGCFTYTEELYAADGPKTVYDHTAGPFVFNCASLPKSIPPYGSIAVAMEADIPADVPTGNVTLMWSAAGGTWAIKDSVTVTE